MRILFLTYGPEIVASSRSRVYQYLRFFRKDGIQCKILNNFSSYSYRLTNALDRYELHGRGRRIFLVLRLSVRWGINVVKGLNVVFSCVQMLRLLFLATAYCYELVFIQKVLVPAPIIKLLKAMGKSIVFDFDDAIFTEKSYFRNKKRFDQLIPLYDLIIVENSFNESYVQGLGNARTLVITGPIDVERYKPRRNSSSNKVVVGWIGSRSSEGSLTIISDVAKRICKEHRHVEFSIIGGRMENKGSANVTEYGWSLESEIDYLRMMDIGIMPVVDNEYNRGKGGYKLLIYMALGIPCCASPVGINTELIQHGSNGFLANNQDEWYAHLTRLIRDENLRREMGLNGRQIVEGVYSFEACYPKMLTALRSVLSRGTLNSRL